MAVCGAYRHSNTPGLRVLTHCTRGCVKTDSGTLACLNIYQPMCFSLHRPARYGKTFVLDIQDWGREKRTAEPALILGVVRTVVRAVGRAVRQVVVAILKHPTARPRQPDTRIRAPGPIWPPPATLPPMTTKFVIKIFFTCVHLFFIFYLFGGRIPPNPFMRPRLRCKHGVYRPRMACAMRGGYQAPGDAKSARRNPRRSWALNAQ